MKIENTENIHNIIIKVLAKSTDYDTINTTEAETRLLSTCLMQPSHVIFFNFK